MACFTNTRTALRVGVSKNTEKPIKPRKLKKKITEKIKS
jgi:hypothetical protein